MHSISIDSKAIQSKTIHSNAKQHDTMQSNAKPSKATPYKAEQCKTTQNYYAGVPHFEHEQRAIASAMQRVTQRAIEIAIQRALPRLAFIKPEIQDCSFTFALLRLV